MHSTGGIVSPQEGGEHHGGIGREYPYRALANTLLWVLTTDYTKPRNIRQNPKILDKYQQISDDNQKRLNTSSNN